MLLLAWLACSSPVPEPAPPTPKPPVGIVAFAAASLTDALPKVADAWEIETGNAVTFRFESTSKLAKQIESGEPADLLFSADAEWMDALAAKDLIVAPSRRDLLGNTLVAIVPAGAAFVPASADDLAGPGLLHLAMAGENVPAGRYGRAALRSAGVWSSVESRVVSGDNVRTALGWVASREAEVGVVYATDARAEPKVKVAFTFPPASHPPIVYPAAALKASAHPSEAAAFLDFCQGKGRAIFEEAGFKSL